MTVRAIFEKIENFAILFSAGATKMMSFEEHELYKDPYDPEDSLGLNFTEFVEHDITNNLVAWSYEKKGTVYYVTEHYLYLFDPREVVEITQVDRNAWTIRRSWLNYHSVGVGREFLKNHKDKLVPIFLSR